MKLLIGGICGTFMAGIARIAKQLGHTVEGVDQGIYPPMSDYLQSQSIVCHSDYDPKILALFKPDLVIIGNALSRGNPFVEAVLNQKIPYTSGPAWLATHVLSQRRVLAVSGTHGKTTTSTMLTWILLSNQLDPGFLIGGLSEALGVSADLGSAPFFVIEADEYDCAFWDKRSKFMHYLPEVLICNNLEFDHGDIFPDLAAIQKQFQYLLRTVPSSGRIIANKNCEALQSVFDAGCWTPIQFFSEKGGKEADCQLVSCDEAGSQFSFRDNTGKVHDVVWPLFGKYNVANALAAIAAAQAVGVLPSDSIKALESFTLPKRRLEVRGVVGDVTVIDDFAHHPTAVALSVQALRDKLGKDKRIVAVLECASNTMRSGVHGDAVFDALQEADEVILKVPDNWSDFSKRLKQYPRYESFPSTDAILTRLMQTLKGAEHVLVMSNKGFDGIHERLLEALLNRIS
jgi:UDP-N-acetylmuramate: L-alanyl-gamma-D-glutamyl-meso-diaminopimelate ligase